VGWNFTINVEKSRFTKEKSKLIFSVNYETGINKWSGLLDLATDLKYLVKGKIGNAIGYSRVDPKTGEVEEKKYRVVDTNDKDFWDPILNNPGFAAAVQDKYMLAYRTLMNSDFDDEEV
jgi:hypothetical protein